MEPSVIPTGLISLVRHQKCDAVFCCNDLAAIITVQHLRESGISVPEQVSVVGFDDVEQARMSAPPLTTVSVPKEHMGSRSAELLLHRLLNPGTPCRHEVLPVDLILRDSVCRAQTQ
jgi:LacI family transcriptional regulator